jgi:hypothetical protein
MRTIKQKLSILANTESYGHLIVVLYTCCTTIETYNSIDKTIETIINSKKTSYIRDN